METLSIQLPFCGFYESCASQMIDDEIERAFDYSDCGGEHNIPDEIWYKAPYAIDYKAIEIELVKAYVDAFADRFEGETGIPLPLTFEEMTSPREYNFTTDRVFCLIPVSAVNAMFTASEADNHAQLAKVIKDTFTSYDGFFSSYSNDLGDWLLKPVLTWDHNELMTLLNAVIAIHETDSTDDWSLWDMLESWAGNGGLSNAVWGAMPKELQAFADVQRDYGKAVDFSLWIKTGIAYEEGSDEAGAALPPPRCDKTIDMKL